MRDVCVKTGEEMVLRGDEGRGMTEKIAIWGENVG